MLLNVLILFQRQPKIQDEIGEDLFDSSLTRRPKGNHDQIIILSKVLHNSINAAYHKVLDQNK